MHLPLRNRIAIGNCCWLSLYMEDPSELFDLVSCRSLLMHFAAYLGGLELWLPWILIILIFVIIPTCRVILVTEKNMSTLIQNVGRYMQVDKVQFLQEVMNLHITIKSKMWQAVFFLSDYFEIKYKYNSYVVRLLRFLYHCYDCLIP